MKLWGLTELIYVNAHGIGPGMWAHASIYWYLLLLNNINFIQWIETAFCGILPWLLVFKFDLYATDTCPLQKKGSKNNWKMLQKL